MDCVECGIIISTEDYCPDCHLPVCLSCERFHTCNEDFEDFDELELEDFELDDSEPTEPVD